MKALAHRRAHSHLPLLIAVLALVLSGCAGSGVAPAPEKRTPLFEQPGGEVSRFWWQACFRMPFDEAGQARWAVDLLLAHRVAEPLLRKYAGDIALWRFHRRAGNGGAGHQFSVIFYADEPTARAFLDEIQQAPPVSALTEAGYLKGMVANCRDRVPNPALEANSDPVWDIRLQRTWPYFIMGVSAHWLALIDEVDRELGAAPEGIEAQLAHYERIRGEITALWQTEGQHAYLHHLNAIFGYEPMGMQWFMRF